MLEAGLRMLKLLPEALGNPKLQHHLQVLRWLSLEVT